LEDDSRTHFAIDDAYKPMRRFAFLHANFDVNLTIQRTVYRDIFL